MEEWYTGDDSNRKRIAYATSADGVTWQKGGKVIAPEDGINANLSEGAFAPTVWKDGSSYNMILTGRKISGGGGGSCPSTFQTKLINASSNDGISWTIGSNALNPGGTVSKFDCSNVDAGDVVLDAGAPAAEQQKLYYSGNTVDANGNAHDQIGLAMSSGGAFNRYTSPSPGTSTDNSIISLSPFGSAFDSQTASGLAVAKAGTTFAGFYSGNRYSDFKPRLGDATSSDGSTWTKETTGADGTTHAILPLSGGSQFDSGGQIDPGALYIQNTGASQPDYFLYFTALSNSGVKSIGYADAQETAVTLVPDNSTWAHKAQVAITTGTYDANGQSDPYPLDDTGTSGKFVLYYAGTSASGVTSVGCITSAAVTFSSPTRCNSGNALISPTASSFDQDGIKDPVVQKIGSTYYLFYTGIEKVTDPGGRTRTIERIGYATSASAASGFLKQGLLIDPSEDAYAFDEIGVEPSGITVDGGTNAIDFYYAGVDRSGRKSAGHATGDTTVTTGNVENGSATYQLGDPTTTVEDWRDIAAVSNGATEIWVSFLQPYSSSSNQFWSDFFPVDAANTTANLDFLLTVTGVRWQVREKTPSGNPSLDSLTIGYAPVHFSPTGNAITKSIAPPPTDKLMQWRTLTVSATQYDPTKSGGTSSGTVHVFDASGSTDLVPSQPLATNGDTSVNLSSISVTDHPALRVRVDMSSGGAVSPLVSSMKVLYYTDKAPPPTPVVTLTATPTTVIGGQNVTLRGTVTVGGTPVASQAVALLSQPTGGSGFTQFTTATTDSTGAFTATVNPTASTDYQASYGGASSAPVTVTVNPPVLTLTAAPVQVIFGKPVTLSGSLTAAGAPVAAAAVDVLQQPAGATTFTSFGSATTDAAGNWSSLVTPQSNTTYEANSANVATPPTAAVAVHQLVALKATRKLSTGTFKGKIAPAHPNRAVVIQLKKGRSFTTFARTKTTTTSTFSLKKALKPCAKYQFRAVTAADADHLDGTSVIALVEKHKVSITVKLEGRTATITGRVSPAHRSGTVLIKEIKGTKATRLGKATITKKSTFKLVLKLKKGKHVLRGDMAADKCHFAGKSANKKLTVR